MSKRQERTAAKARLLNALEESQKKARKLEGKRAIPASNKDISHAQSHHKQLAMLRSLRRRAKHPVLSGSVLNQSGVGALDALADMRNYDEMFFEKNVHGEILRLGLEKKCLQPAEIALLKSNSKVDRKTILLNQWNLFNLRDRDQIYQELDETAKHEALLRKLGQNYMSDLMERSRQQDVADFVI